MTLNAMSIYLSPGCESPSIYEVLIRKCPLQFTTFIRSLLCSMLNPQYYSIRETNLINTFLLSGQISGRDHYEINEEYDN